MSNQMFEIVRFKCAGIDVHKNYFVVTVSVTDEITLETTCHTQEFHGFNSELDQMCDFLRSYGVDDVCMESTGKYWIPVVKKLEANNIRYKLVHPKYVKAVSGHKTDKADSQFICRMYACDLCGPGSVILPEKYREIRDLARRYWVLGYDLVAEKNRYQNCLTVSNLPLDAIFSDPLGKSALAVMDEILAGHEDDEARILSVIHSRCKNKDKIMDAIRGSSFSPDQRFKITDIRSHMDELEQHRKHVFTQIITNLCDDMEDTVLLTSIPGISVTSAVLIVSEIGMNMDFWKDGRNLTAWAGLTPRNDQSHGKKKSTRITKAGTYLKPLLVQSALAAIKQKNGYFTRKYNRIKRRRGHKKAILAIARMILISAYNVLKKKEAFHPTDYEDVMNPNKKAKKVSEQDAIRTLESLGYNIDQITRTITPVSSPVVLHLTT